MAGARRSGGRVVTNDVLPKVLAGPIVRRVDGDGVAVWIALSEPATKIELTAWRGTGHVSTGPGRVTSGDPPQTTGEAATLPLGIGLHVAVVAAEFSGGSPPSQIFSYDVVVDDVGLLGLGLLADEAPSVAADGRPGRLALGYAPGVLPSFVTPPADLADLRFAQASCRNPKQPGHDAMPWLDDVLARTIADPVQRPQQLFLTGDQVYVDDVAAVHLAMLADLGVELVGDESMPFADLPGDTDGPEFVKVTRASVPPLRRKHPVRTIARFSNAAGHSHLLTRGEFAAMYLSAWSPSVWRPLVGDTELTAKPAPPESDPDARSLTKMASKWPEAKDLAALARDRANLERFRDQLPRVARALANIATYMIADDHEIADDWNLTQSWTARVRLSPLGSSIIRHGLAAFFVFQAWGNDPNFYGQGGRLKPKAGRERKILDLLVADAAALSDRRGEQSVDDLDDAFGLTPTLGANPAPQLRFDFRVESLVHVVVGLDTRTRRAASRGPESPPNLLGTTIDDQIPAGPLSDGRLLLVLCAEPLLKPVAFESLVKPAATAVFDIKSYAAYTGELGDPARPLRGFEKYEVESFGAVELHFEAVLERLSTHPRVVVLSGEIHFAVDMVLDYFLGAEGAATSRIVQLTSSAAKNPVSPMEQMVTRSHRWARTALHAEPFERLGWRRPAPIQLPATQSIPPGRRARMLRDVALLPAADWPKGTTIPTGDDPDWTWRLRPLRDERPDPIRLPPPQPPLPTFDPSRPLETAALIAARHAELARSPNEPVRGIVFRANIGVVRFERTEPDGVKVVHDVYSADGPTIETGSVYTRHEIELEAPSPSDRPVLGFVP